MLNVHDKVEIPCQVSNGMLENELYVEVTIPKSNTTIQIFAHERSVELEEVLDTKSEDSVKGWLLVAVSAILDEYVVVILPQQPANHGTILTVPLSFLRNPN